MPKKSEDAPEVELVPIAPAIVVADGEEEEDDLDGIAAISESTAHALLEDLRAALPEIRGLRRELDRSLAPVGGTPRRPGGLFRRGGSK